VPASVVGQSLTVVHCANVTLRSVSQLYTVPASVVGQSLTVVHCANVTVRSVSQLYTVPTSLLGQSLTVLHCTNFNVSVPNSDHNCDACHAGKYSRVFISTRIYRSSTFISNLQLHGRRESSVFGRAHKDNKYRHSNIPIRRCYYLIVNFNDVVWLQLYE